MRAVYLWWDIELQQIFYQFNFLLAQGPIDSIK